jgi:1,4-dihydroxy-6-naphthoate synthase
MKLSIGFSPCPNDTFIFDALVNGKIDTGDLEFEAVLEDVETLNQWALEGKLDITKLSFAAFFEVIDTYLLLQAGSALGKGVGPLLVSKRPATPDTGIIHKSVALPGKHTTANLLLDFACPGMENKKFMVFSEIENAVLNEEAELGVIIHENRFTYAERGLHLVMDLGKAWENRMEVPVPLGGIAIRRSIKLDTAEKVNELIRRSLQYAFEKYPLISDYIKGHSQTMSETVMRQHIDLYVNEYSLDLGVAGRNAVKVLQEIYRRQTGNSQDFQDLFIGN